MQADKKERFMDMTEFFLAGLLVLILVSAIFSVYKVSVLSIWNLAALGICVLVFCFCEVVKRHRYIGGIAMTAFVGAVYWLFVRLAVGDDFGQEFGQWFFSGADVVDTTPRLLLALLVGFPAFFSLTIYYFTRIRYRLSVLTLISLIPCVLYVKITAELNNIYLVLIAACNGAIVVLHSYKNRNREAKRIGKGAAAASCGIFLFFLMLIAAAIPKKAEAKYYDIFQDLFMDGNVSVELESDYSNMSDFSGNADHYEDFQNRRMYSLYGENSTYLKRQTFDYYNFKLDRWYPEKKYSNPDMTGEEYSHEKYQLNLTFLQRGIRQAERYQPGFAGKYGLEELMEGDLIRERTHRLYVQSQNFGAVYYLSPARVISVSGQDISGDIYVTKGGVFRRRKTPHEKYVSYEVLFYDDFSSRNAWLEKGGGNFDNEGALVMLEELAAILEENEDTNAGYARCFYEQQEEAETYRKLCAENTEQISDTVRKLAEKITKGAVYDWEKAQALQDYFRNGDFTYDIAYRDSDTSPEHFLLESRTGSCSDFAGAYVLLARAAGLTVRYAEGYVPKASVRENMYTIADSNSHAYAEVFIQNIGWVVFEPTLPSRYNTYGEEEENAFLAFFRSLEMDVRLLAVIVTAGLAALVLVWLFRTAFPWLFERLFVLRLYFTEERTCVRKIYQRMTRKHLKKRIKGVEALTPYEVAQETEKRIGFEAYGFVFLAEEVFYGKRMPTREEKKDSIKVYRQWRRAVRKL